MDYSLIFRSFLSSIVSVDSSLQINDLIKLLLTDSNKTRDLENLKSELLLKLNLKNNLKISLKDFVTELSTIIKELEDSILPITQYEPLDQEIILEFARSLSATTHPSLYSNEPPIPQDSKMRSSLLFNQSIKESVQVNQVSQEEDVSMNWINTTTQDKEAKADLSLLDLDL